MSLGLIPASSQEAQYSRRHHAWASHQIHIDPSSQSDQGGVGQDSGANHTVDGVVPAAEDDKWKSC